MSIPFGSHQPRHLFEGDFTTRLFINSVEHFFQRERSCLPAQVGPQILLKRHSCISSSSTQRGVDVVGNVFHLDAGHADTLTPEWRHFGATGEPYRPPATVMVWPVTQLPASLAR